MVPSTLEVEVYARPRLVLPTVIAIELSTIPMEGSSRTIPRQSRPNPSYSPSHKLLVK